MNPESENFDQLRRLLSLKRHEQPPPGYFTRFSGRVISRIEAGEYADERSGVFGENGWFHRFWAALDARPALAGAVGVAICGVFAVGLIVSDKGDSNPVAMAAPQGFGGVQLASQASASSLDNAIIGRPVSVEFPSTVGIGPAQPIGSVFDNLQMPRATLTSFPASN